MRPLVLAVVVLLSRLTAVAAPDPSFDGGGGSPAPAPAPAVPQASGAAVEADSRLWIVAAAASAAQRTILADAGVSIEEITPERVAGIAGPAAAARLRAQGIAFTSQPLAQRFAALDFPSEDAVFHNYDRLTADLRALAAQAPELASMLPVGVSLQGRTMWALRLNTSARGDAPSDKPGALFLGTHHAREHLSTEVPLLLARHLIENRRRADIAALLAARDIFIVPMVNPDGVEFDVSSGRYHMHRKNMRPLGSDEYGVDLNRNYGYHWGGHGASDDPADETYRGPSAFSEPETQAVKAFIEARPNLKVLLSYHTFSELILYPWGHTDSPISDGRALSAYRAMAETMGRMTGYKPKQSSQLYITSGDTTDWAWGERGIFSFTFELTPKTMWSGGFYPGAGAIASTFQANIRPALYLIDLADDPYRAGNPGPALGGR